MVRDLRSEKGTIGVMKKHLLSINHTISQKPYDIQSTVSTLQEHIKD